MKKELLLLKQEFEKIKNLGYIESSRKGFTGIGKTFEDLIGKEEDTLETPDYHGIEIKTKRGYSKSYVHLFHATPKGKNDFEIKRLCNTYGYPDKIKKEYKVLAFSIQGNKSVFVANRFLFKLSIDYENKKIYLIICDKNMQLVEQDIYWDFDLIQEKLERKLSYLAFIKAWSKTIKGIDYYNYYAIQFYELKSFNVFLFLMEQGVIRITFKIGVFREGPRMDEIHDRGTSFEIEEQNIQKLFNQLNI